jgi:coproporphyrinogen III oxidase-like Fe-S oxidoreductase
MPPTPSDSLRIERAIYAKVVAAMDYPEPSTLVHDMGGKRSRRHRADELAERWKTATARPAAGAIFNLYVHVPYCKSICDFCNYKRLRVSSREGLDEFVSFIVSEAKLFAPAFQNARFGGLFVGGGTPSVLAPDQLDRMFDTLMASFAFREGAQKNFEFDPMVMTEERYRVVEKYGFTRFSFGIQSVDVDVNRLHNRGSQNRSHLEKQFRLLGEHGGEHTNVDFLLGLAGTTAEQMLGEIEQVMTEFSPSEISIYFIFPTEEYVKAHFAGDYHAFARFLEPFERLVPPTLRQLAERLDYCIAGDGQHTITLYRPAQRPASGGPDAGLLYCDVPSNAHRPLHVLGLGDSARSRIFGDLVYRAEHDHDDTSPTRDRYVGVDTTMADEMFAYVAMVLRDGNRLSRALFRRTFGVDPVVSLSRPIQKLSELGVASVDDDAVELRQQTRADRLRDILFFLPPERRDALGDVSLLTRGSGS